MLNAALLAQSPRILFVDDEPAVLEAIERALFDVDYDITSDTQPARALGRLVSEGPFDVVVSDMRMPVMDGAAFLAAASHAAPDTMRILLTGQADVAAAAAAVNAGNILRFLQKPCDAGDLENAIEEAVRRRRSILAEREMLESTLTGAVRAMSEMLQILAPDVFRRSSSLARAAAHVAARLSFEPRWSLEVAALLCQVGCIALPLDLVEHERRGDEMSPEDRALFDSHPETGFRLLSNIPRLEGVAAMVRHQRHVDLPGDLPRGAPTGARVLRVLLELDHRVSRGERFEAARLALRRAAPREEAAILDALASYSPGNDGPSARAVSFRKLAVGMVLAEDVLTKHGAVIVGKGSEVTLLVYERLHNFARGVGVQEPICVRAAA